MQSQQTKHHIVGRKTNKMTNALEELRKVLLEASNAQKKKEVLIEIKEEPLVEEESIAQKTARFLNTNNDNVPAAHKTLNLKDGMTPS